MSPIDFIKEGILECNWETVCEGYERLTGEALRFPIEQANNRAQEILDQITELLSQDCEVPQKLKKKVGRPKKNSKKKTNKKTIVTEDGEDMSLQLDDNHRTPGKHKEAGEIHLITNEPDPDEIESNKSKAARASSNKLKLGRTKTRTYDVECNECGDPFESSRPHGQMGQKCMKCLNSLKSRFSG